MLDILAPTRHIRTWNGSVRYAAELATLIDASLTGVYVCEPISAMLGMDGPMLLSEGVAYVQEHLQAAHDAGGAFNRWAGELGVQNSHWRVAHNNVLPALSYASHWHDLLVLQSNPDLVGEVGGLLLSLALPCLAVPNRVENVRLDCIALAWNGSVESIRAIRVTLSRVLCTVRGEPGSTSTERSPFSRK